MNIHSIVIVKANGDTISRAYNDDLAVVMSRAQERREDFPGATVTVVTTHA